MLHIELGIFIQYLKLWTKSIKTCIFDGPEIKKLFIYPNMANCITVGKKCMGNNKLVNQPQHIQKLKLHFLKNYISLKLIQDIRILEERYQVTAMQMLWLITAGTVR